MYTIQCRSNFYCGKVWKLCDFVARLTITIFEMTLNFNKSYSLYADTVATRWIPVNCFFFFLMSLIRIIFYPLLCRLILTAAKWNGALVFVFAVVFFFSVRLYLLSMNSSSANHQVCMHSTQAHTNTQSVWMFSSCVFSNSVNSFGSRDWISNEWNVNMCNVAFIQISRVLPIPHDTLLYCFLILMVVLFPLLPFA